MGKTKKGKRKKNKLNRYNKNHQNNHQDNHKNQNKDQNKDVKEIKKIESEVLTNSEILEVVTTQKKQCKEKNKDLLEQIMFDLPYVEDPLIGTPRQVQKKLDALAKSMQKNPYDDKIFNKIHLYMHGYLVNIVLKKFPFIRGLQTADIYQETLIALRFKAIPNFKTNKGMSFLNFAKMCIRRHLITLLNTSKNRKRDQSINQAIPLESSPLKEDEVNSKNTFANIIADKKASADEEIEYNEAFEITKSTLYNALSKFEQIVLTEYLSNSSYKEISKNMSRILNKRCNTKSIDNALLRIRKKALYLKCHMRPEELPLFISKSKSKSK